MVTGKQDGLAFIGGRSHGRPQARGVIFLHGSGLASAFWQRQVNDLADVMATVAVDLPGHGASDPPALESVSDCAAAVMAFIRTRGWQQTFVCGLSLGGAIALQLLLDHPDELAGGILIGTGARLRVRPEILACIANDYPGFVGATDAMAASPQTAAQSLAPVRALMAACPPTVTATDFRACDRFDVMDRLTEVRVPVQVICGADDLLTPVKYSDYLCRQIPGAQQVIIPGGGHLVPWEQPAAVNQAIRRFVAAVTA